MNKMESVEIQVRMTCKQGHLSMKWVSLPIATAIANGTAQVRCPACDAQKH